MPESGTFKLYKDGCGAGVTAVYGWRYLRAAGLVTGFSGRKTVRVALIVLLSVIVIRLLDRCSYMMFDRAGLEQTLSPWVRSSLNLFRSISTLAVAFSMAVLARSRSIYRLARPLAVKGVLLALAMIPMIFPFEARYAFVALVFSTPYIIAFLMMASTLVRRLVKDLRWF